MAYTFKDDGGRMTYYREYNKEVSSAGDKTLVGNWVEERALRAEVQTGRYPLWTSSCLEPAARERTFSKGTARPDNADTFRRVFFHSDHTPPSEYASHNVEKMGAGGRAYSTPKKGARERLLDARARAAAREQELAALAPPPAAPLRTSAQEHYVPKALPPPAERGSKVMNPRGEGKRADLTWRKEAGLVPPHRMEDPSAPVNYDAFATASRNFAKDTSFSNHPFKATTRWEHKVRD